MGRVCVVCTQKELSHTDRDTDRHRQTDTERKTAIDPIYIMSISPDQVASLVFTPNYYIRFYTR